MRYAPAGQSVSSRQGIALAIRQPPHCVGLAPPMRIKPYEANYGAKLIDINQGRGLDQPFLKVLVDDFCQTNSCLQEVILHER
jgi:hypothetical protein